MNQAMLNVETDTVHRPFFIVGAQRSGTTMLRLMMNAHPRLAVPFESNFIPDKYRELESYGDLSHAGNIARLLDDISENRFVKRGSLITDKTEILSGAPKNYPELINGIYSVYARKRGKSRWGDKDPSYTTQLDILNSLFPDCYIIHIVRDGRDVAISNRNVDWGSRHVLNVARRWQWQVTLAHKMGAMMGNRFFEVRYEDLVRQPETTLAGICEFIGEEFSHRMLDYHQEARAEMPADSMKYHNNSVSAPNPQKAELWKREMSPSDVILFEQIAGATLADFGYEVSGRKPGLLVRLKQLKYSLIVRW